jgi:S-DNA-T family DNA segregation ATPase FtsK/SpoIIIE
MNNILKQLKIKAEVSKVENNGTTTKYYLNLHPGAKVSKIENCATEIALALKAYSKPIIRTIPHEGVVVVELLVRPMDKVPFSDMSDDLIKFDKSTIPMILGKTHDGENLITDLTIMPHLLIAGATGSGKSVMLHSILNSFMLRNNVRLALIDPKKVEFSYYNNIKQLLYPVITEPDDALCVLSDLIEEMENRFRLMSKASVNNIASFNSKKDKLPYIVLVIDEFSDLMYSSKKEFQKQVCMLAQKARAAGIHLICATQRPSVDVITGLIKANFPARISCMVSSSMDSRVVLGANGAEKLLGKGDALINSIGFNMVRFQGAFLDTDEIEKLCVENQKGKLARLINFIRGA